MAYKHGISRLQQDTQEDWLWFAYQVMPAVQKKYKPIQVDKPLQDSYNLVILSDKAFGFFAWSTTMTTLPTLRGRGKPINHLWPTKKITMMAHKSGKINWRKNSRRLWKNTTIGTTVYLNLRNKNIGIWVAISRCIVGNWTMAIKKKRNWKIMV